MNETYDVSAFRAVFERSFTWISGFLRNVRRFGEKTAVIDPASGRTWTYAALNRDANRLANALLAAGVGPGDVVLYQLYNSTPSVLSYLSPTFSGAPMARTNCVASSSWSSTTSPWPPPPATTAFALPFAPRFCAAYAPAPP